MPPAVHPWQVLDRVAPFFEDPLVTDLVFNRFDQALAKVGRFWVPLDSPFASGEDLIDWLVETVEGAGARLDFQNPATSVVSHGFRVHAVLPAGVTANARATIRRLKSPNLRFDYSDVATAVRLEVLTAAFRSRKNLLIAGAAGAGKTTLLRHLLSPCHEDRIITIEDAPELQLDLPNAVSLVSRSSNSESAGEIGLQRLVFEALRMSPDRLVVGEVRGSELVAMLDALNTGHTGAGATIHANSLASVAARLQSIGRSCGLSEQAVAMQVNAAFDLVAFVSNKDGYRIDAVGEFCMREGMLEVRQIE